MGVTEFVLDPWSFLEHRDESRVSVLVLLLVAVVPGVVSDLYSTWWSLKEVPVAAGVATYGLTAIVSLVVPLAIWAGMAIAIRVVSLAVTMDGQFTKLLKLSAYGMIPYAISGVVGLVATALVLNDLQSPQTVEALQQAGTRIQNDPRVRTANLVHLEFLLWSGLLWSAATAVSLDVTKRKAALLVAGPLAALLGVQAFLVL
ncbi:YIP1 family protein [Halorussus halobius]|uniref:YIP1 family protein n=1 Tax=Halorussus halobius TaxID=1710537 RepID=UPI001091C3A6|nr:YIP1 family protein [Halorussus halobius]